MELVKTKSLTKPQRSFKENPENSAFTESME